MMSERSFTEDEVQELSGRIFLLRAQIDAGKFRLAPHLADDFKRSWAAVRYRPDGLVDPYTVDGQIRSAALVVSSFKMRDEAKQDVSLSDIQDAYFTVLFRELGGLYESMCRAGANPAQAARVFVRDDKFVSQTISAIPAMAEGLREFWDAVGDAGAFHLQDGQQLKATFAGDLFPAHWENAVSTAGLYIDTIILPCPILRIAPLVNVAPDREVVAMFIKHTFTAMSYRDVATADLNPPIAVVLPNSDDFDVESRQFLLERAQPWICKHAQYLFGRSFESIEDLSAFCGHLKTVDDAMSELKRPDRLIFDTEWDRDPRAQLRRVMSEGLPAIPNGTGHAGDYIFSSCVGRMPQAMAAQEKALEFGGTPLINAETSWLYYKWLLEYEAAVPGPESDQGSMHIVRALVAESQNNLAWLGNVPPATVLEIRRRGLAQEVRAMLGNGISELVKINPQNYSRTADRVVENLDHAFREHQRAVLEAKQKKLKLYGVDCSGFVATGALAVTAALTESPVLGAVSGLLGMVGLPNLKDIKSRYSELRAEDAARKSSPTGLLFRHVRKGT